MNKKYDKKELREKLTGRKFEIFTDKVKEKEYINWVIVEKEFS